MSTNDPGAGPPPATTHADFKGSLDEEGQLQARLNELRAGRGEATVASSHTPPPAPIEGSAASLDNQSLLALLQKMQKRMDELEKAAQFVPTFAPPAPYMHWVNGQEKVALIIDPGQEGYPQKDPPKDADGNLVPWMETGMHRT
jgi:hypothetical protein